MQSLPTTQSSSKAQSSVAFHEVHGFRYAAEQVQDMTPVKKFSLVPQDKEGSPAKQGTLSSEPAKSAQRAKETTMDDASAFDECIKELQLLVAKQELGIERVHEVIANTEQKFSSNLLNTMEHTQREFEHLDQSVKHLGDRLQQVSSWQSRISDEIRLTSKQQIALANEIAADQIAQFAAKATHLEEQLSILFPRLAKNNAVEGQGVNGARLLTMDIRMNCIEERLAKEPVRDERDSNPAVSRKPRSNKTSKSCKTSFAYVVNGDGSPAITRDSSPVCHLDLPISESPDPALGPFEDNSPLAIPLAREATRPQKRPSTAGGFPSSRRELEVHRDGKSTLRGLITPGQKVDSSRPQTPVVLMAPNAESQASDTFETANQGPPVSQQEPITPNFSGWTCHMDGTPRTASTGLGAPGRRVDGITGGSVLAQQQKKGRPPSARCGSARRRATHQTGSQCQVTAKRILCCADENGDLGFPVPLDLMLPAK